MILNLLRVEAIRVEDMIKRSFSENSTQKALPEQQVLHNETSQKLKSVAPLVCAICKQDIDYFYDCSSRIINICHALMGHILKHPAGMKSLTAGRIVILNNQVHVINIELPKQSCCHSSGRLEAWRDDSSGDKCCSGRLGKFIQPC